jgi:hypothetical protein
MSKPILLINDMGLQINSKSLFAAKAKIKKRKEERKCNQGLG